MCFFKTDTVCLQLHTKDPFVGQISQILNTRTSPDVVWQFQIDDQTDLISSVRNFAFLKCNGLFMSVMNRSLNDGEIKYNFAQRTVNMKP
jgi:hypothetical protein